MSALKINTTKTKAPSKSSASAKVNVIKEKILHLIALNDYKGAVEALKSYHDQDFPYSTYRMKIERYVAHATDLILAIESNKNFPGMNSLTRPKQQELREKSKRFLEELTQILDQVEKSYDQLKIADLRTTTYFVKSFWIAMLIVGVTVIVNDFFRAGISQKFLVLAEYYINSLVQMLSKYI